MQIENCEFKARIHSITAYEAILMKINPIYIGLDQQKDTYFNCNEGRLKLREGNIENALISYIRENTANSKQSIITLYNHKPDAALKIILEQQFGTKVVVNKLRKIYFVDNVKFHFDIVEDLGTFLEVEAINENGKFSYEELKAQCDYFFDYFQLSSEDLIENSYSDLILELV